MFITITTPGFVYQDTDTGVFSHHEYKLSYDWVAFVCPAESICTFQLPPDYHPIKAKIAATQEKLEKAAEAYYGLKAELKGKIADLQAIGYDSPVQVPTDFDGIPF